MFFTNIIFDAVHIEYCGVKSAIFQIKSITNKTKI